MLDKVMSVAGHLATIVVIIWIVAKIFGAPKPIAAAPVPEGIRLRYDEARVM